MISLALLLALQFSPGAPGSADPPKASATAVSLGRTKADPNKQICRANMSTGHHIADHVCHTQAEWDQQEANGKATLDTMTRVSSACAGFPLCS